MPNYYNDLNKKLNSEQAEVNAKFIRNYLHAKGWTLNAICGVLGNFHSETGGTFNPNVYEGWKTHSSQLGKYGYGLAQWTPWLGTSTYNTAEEQRHYHGTNNPTFGRWCLDNGLEKSKMETQLEYLHRGLGGYSTKYWSEKITWDEFIHSDKDPDELAKIFYKNYERSQSNSYGSRPSHAETWYEFFGGSGDSGGSGTVIPPEAPPPESIDNSVIGKAIAWAVGVANDDSHGYDQEHRWGNDYDCSSLVIQAFEQAGLPVKTNGATSTADMRDVFKSSGFIELMYTPSMVLKAGDVLWKEGHTALMVDAFDVVEATLNEWDDITGGQTGDQTGFEIYVHELNRSRDFTYVLRLPAENFTPTKRGFPKLLLFAVASDLA